MYTIKERLEGVYGITRTPQYIANRCTNRKSQGESCTACADICPEHIYPTGKRKHPVWDQCIRCGLCAAACPARCIVPPADRVNSYLMAVAKRGPLTVGCNSEEHTFQLSLRCLAAISWEQLAYAALQKGVVISLRQCAGCDCKAEYAIIQANLETLRKFLGENRFRQAVTILTDENQSYTPPKETVSRRELLCFIGSTPLDKAFTMLPKVESKRDNALFYRAMLRDAVDEARQKNPESGEKFGMVLPRFNNHCYNCGYCAHACPNDALKLLSGGPTFTVAVDAWKCTGCGICQNTCRSDGISGILPVKLSHLRTVALGRFPTSNCAECGNPFPPNPGVELCATCMNRRRAQELRRKRTEAYASRTEEKDGEHG